ncbi:MAG TPA: four helix bundle protein [Terriglobales bacterium]|nr:four helix bundle protein [Terriglobales bacterium]
MIAWQKAMGLVKEIYRATRAFPKEELYGLTSQLRRAAISVPSNLAEGHGRASRKEFHLFIGHARGSLLEIETQLEIARDLGYLAASDAAELLAKASEVARVVNGLRAWSESEVGARAADS